MKQRNPSRTKKETSRAGRVLGGIGFVLLCAFTVLCFAAWIWQSRNWEDLKLVEMYSQLKLSIGGTGEGFASRFVAMELLVDGKPVRSARPQGTDPKAMNWNSWDVHELKGESANIRIRVDSLPARMRNPLARYILVD